LALLSIGRLIGGRPCVTGTSEASTALRRAAWQPPRQEIAACPDTELRAAPTRSFDRSVVRGGLEVLLGGDE
jgi:hypothetical protein